MPVPSTIADLSTNPSSNYPAGSDLPSALDDAQRSLAAIVKQNVSKGIDIASASTITIPNTGNYFVVTGTTGISAINDAWFGRTVVLKFSGAAILTNSSGLILPGAANITTAAGDCFIATNESTGVWRVVLYQPANGVFPRSGGSLTGAINTARATVASHATTADIWGAAGNQIDWTGTATTTAFPAAPQAGASRRLIMAAAASFTAGANMLIDGVASGNTITLAANDVVDVEAVSTTQFRLLVTKYDGTAIVPTPSILGSYRNLVIVNNVTNPNYQLDVDSDEVVLKNSAGAAYLASSVNLTLDITASGANGLDTGSEANSTWYFSWVIYNPTTATVAGLLSTSSTAPTLPSGYTYKALVGAIYNDGSGNFVGLSQLNNKVTHTANRTILDGTATADAWTSVSVAAFFPTTARKVSVIMAHSGSSLRVGLSNRSDGMGGQVANSTTGGGSSTFGGVLPTSKTGAAALECQYAATLYYWVGTSPASVIATGWEY